MALDLFSSYLDNANDIENKNLNFIVQVPLTWNRRIMLHISPRIARGFPSTMSNPLMPTSFTLKGIVNSVFDAFDKVLYNSS